VTLVSGAVSGDSLTVVAFASFNVANTYTQAQIDAALALKSPSASPTFTGTVVLPVTTNYDGTQLSTALDAKLNLAGGKILQVVSTAKADTFTYSGTAFGEVTGLTVTITPSSASSKILVIASVVGQRNFGNANVGQFTIFRDSVNIMSPTSPGSRTPSFSSGVQMGDTNGNVNMEPYHYTYLDNPSTTSAIIYGVRCRNAAGSETTYVNRSEDDSDGVTRPRGVSTITVMEVSA
jgi:hypothetical protein